METVLWLLSFDFPLGKHKAFSRFLTAWIFFWGGEASTFAITDRCEEVGEVLRRPDLRQPRPVRGAQLLRLGPGLHGAPGDVQAARVGRVVGGGVRGAGGRGGGGGWNAKKGRYMITPLQANGTFRKASYLPLETRTITIATGAKLQIAAPLWRGIVRWRRRWRSG